MSTILITGANGSLGSALADSLKDSYDIVPMDLPDSITDPVAVAQAMEGAAAVIHCAAIPWNIKPYHQVVETNVVGTFVLLEEAARRKEVKQFIYISSIVWHGLSEPHLAIHMPDYLPIDENHPSKAGDFYSGSKVQAEFWCRKYVERYRKPLVVVRPSLIVRPAMETTFRAQPAQEVPHLHDYVGATDLIDGIRRALDYDPPDGFDRFLFHAADQRSTTPSLDLVERFFPDVPADREKLGGFAALVDCAHAREKLGWMPHYRCLRD